MPRCTDGGAAPGRALSANYLSGTVRRMDFGRNGTPRTSTAPGSRQAFPIEQFPPAGPEAEYAAMQP